MQLQEHVLYLMYKTICDFQIDHNTLSCRWGLPLSVFQMRWFTKMVELPLLDLIRPFVVLVCAAKFIYRHAAYRQNKIISPGANRPSRFL